MMFLMKRTLSQQSNLKASGIVNLTSTNGNGAIHLLNIQIKAEVRFTLASSKILFWNLVKAKIRPMVKKAMRA